MAGHAFIGGVLIPTAIVMVRTRLPKNPQPIGIAVFGLTATFAPAICPTVGGWLTDNLSWHYIFNLNLLFGPLAVAIQLSAFENAPARWGELLKGDWIGIGLMANSLPALTYVMEEGQRKDRFGSPVIVQASWLAAAGIVGFIVRELTTTRPFVNLRVLANRSVGGASVLMTVLGAVSFGSIYIIPVNCAQIQGYNAQQIGYVAMWSRLPQLLLFPMMPLLVKTVDARLLVVTGTLFFIASCWINVGLTHDVGMDQLIMPQLMRAIGQPLFTIPLSQLSTMGLNLRDTADASALSNMMRNLGGSIGIAMLSTMIDQREHMHFTVLAEAITVNATRTQERVSMIAARLHAHIADPVAAKGAAVGLLVGQVQREANVMAYADGFWLVGVSLVLSLGVVAILRKLQPSTGPVEAHGASRPSRIACPLGAGYRRPVRAPPPRADRSYYVSSRAARHPPNAGPGPRQCRSCPQCAWAGSWRPSQAHQASPACPHPSTLMGTSVVDGHMKESRR